MVADCFAGKTAATVAQSTWPPRPGMALDKPNALVVLFDDVGISGLVCYGATMRTATIVARAARGALDRLAHRGHEFTGRRRLVTVTLDPLADLDGQAVGQAEMARQQPAHPLEKP